MDFGTILKDVYRRTGYSDAPPSEVSTRISAFVNQWHRRILTMPGLEMLRNDTFTFASVANTSVYAFPQSVLKINAITQRDSDVRLHMRTLDWYRRYVPDPAQTTGIPDIWIPGGFRAVAAQPDFPAFATGKPLYAVSSSGSDTAGPKVVIESIRKGGYPYNNGTGTSLTGTSRVQIGTFSDHVEVTKFYLSAACVGFISLYDAAAAGNELARIAIGDTYSRVMYIHLYPTPSSAITYYVDYTRQILDMANATDEPLLPQDYHYLLSLGARADEYERKDDSRSDQAKRDMDAGLRNMKHALLNPPDYLVVPGVESSNRSNLGPWYPPGVW